MTRLEFDLVVVGAGMAGLAATRKAAKAGKRVAIVDEAPYGGTCALRGCDPKKVLVGATEVLDAARRLGGHGIEGEVAIDWPALMAFKRTFTEPTPARIEKGLERRGVTTLHGPARFTSPDKVAVGDDELSAGHVLIASGATPRELGIPGEELVATSTDFLDLDELPDRITFIGGGYVSFELAHVAARAGAKVTICDRSERPLDRFDPDLVDQLVQASQELGIDIRSRTEITKVRRSGDHLTATTRDGPEVEADLVVHGAGRTPNLATLDLATGSVDFDPQAGVRVNQHLQSVSNPRVYAAGDAADTAGWPLTPVAVHEGIVAVSNLLRGNEKTPDYLGTPSVVFTVPALARAGLSEAEATEQGLDFEVVSKDGSRWFSARRSRASHAASKVLVEKGSGRILGAHLLSGEAGEVIDIFALAVRHGITARELRASPLVHPAAASDVVYMV